MKKKNIITRTILLLAVLFVSVYAKAATRIPDNLAKEYELAKEFLAKKGIDADLCMFANTASLQLRYAISYDSAKHINIIVDGEEHKVVGYETTVEPMDSIHAKEIIASEPVPSKDDDNMVYDAIEQMPSFPGGPAALMRYLSSHIKYPDEAEKNGIQGRVICTFVVEKDGHITDVNVLKSVDPSLDNEAVRVVKSMPNWIPGELSGSAVRVKYTLPVTFKKAKKVIASEPVPSKYDDNNIDKDVLKAKEIIASEPVPSKYDETRVFDVVEQMPSFPGGTAALMQYLSSNIKYPDVAEKNGIQGRVICDFVVEKDGHITDIRVLKSVDPSLDKEAVRVVKSMPNWIPGKLLGSAVRVKYTLPVTFRLQ